MLKPGSASRRFRELVSLATILASCRLSRQLKSERSLGKAATIDAGPTRQNTGKAARLDLLRFVPFRLNPHPQIDHQPRGDGALGTADRRARRERGGSPRIPPAPDAQGPRAL